MPRVLLCLSLALSLPLPLRAADWSQFRGPTGQGQAESKNLPTEWGPDKNITWRKELPGKGWSSPVVAAGKIYLTTAVQTGNTLSLRALCLDAANGNMNWDKEVFSVAKSAAGPAHGKNSYASPTAIVEGGKVYIHFGHLGTACLDAGSGSRVWANQTIKYSPVHGNGGSPVLVGDRLIFCVDGADKRFVVGLNKATGTEVWRTPRNVTAPKGFSFCTPLLITVKGQPQVVCPGSNVVTSLDPKTGKEIWRVRYNGYSVVPKPVFGNGLVYLSTGYDTPVLYAIRADGKGDVTQTHVAWTAEKGVHRNASPLLVGDSFYMVSDGGILSCLDAKTGTERWNERVPGAYSASMVAAGGLIYLLNEEGTATVFRPGPSYAPVAESKLREKTLASYGVDGDALLIRTEKALYRVEKK